MIREKQTRSGGLLEVDFYPVFNDGRRMPSRKKKENPSTEQQAKYNERKAVKKLVELVNLNFDTEDYYFHPTYSPEHAPASIEQARKDINNYLRKVKRHRERALKVVNAQIVEIKAEVNSFNSKFLSERLEALKKQRKLLSREFKYIYVIEKKRLFHFHMFITGGLSKSEMESLWGLGIRVNADTYKPDIFGYEAAAKYMGKNPEGSKIYVCSRNLKKPQPKTRDGILTRGGLATIAQTRIDDARYWERKYKGFRFVKVYSRFNTFNNHWYVSVVMYKTENTPPEWSFEPEEWLVDDFNGDFDYTNLKRKTNY